jgi:hypothetical protein
MDAAFVLFGRDASWLEKPVMGEVARASGRLLDAGALPAHFP